MRITTLLSAAATALAASMGINLRFLLLFGTFVLAATMGVSPAIAQVTIQEVQVVDETGFPDGDPEFLVIYGTGFGDLDAIFLGTQKVPLIIPADQGFCSFISFPPPPPLDPTATDCVVAELPDPIPCGDYLLSLEVPPTSCQFGTRPEALVFEYTGEDCDPTMDNLQGGTFQCSGDPAFAAPVQVICDTADCDADPSGQSVALGGMVTLDGNGSKLFPNIDIRILSGASTLQDLRIHTSCSQPLDEGDRFGSLVLTEFVPLGTSANNVTSIFAEYDLTICPIEGPQGPQGKLGDTGAQGPQGKLGDTGAQGVQGKLGDQGVQGKLGDQGPQGKLGAQGAQGKLGPQGDQGVQGKLGDTGDQGVQGKIGPQGEQGERGPGTNLLCFATDQTIGNQGKYMGLGQQAGEHDSVGVISPFSGAAQVLTLVVKVAQGNSPRDGVANLFHDGPTDEGLVLSPDCELLAEASSSNCKVNFVGDLDELDSLSVFVKPDSGSFEGATACVLIDPDGGN